MIYLVQPKTQAERNQVVSIFSSFSFKLTWYAKHDETMWHFWVYAKEVHPHRRVIFEDIEYVPVNKLYDLLNKL